MAKFLTTTANSFYIEEIIMKAEKKISLITPFLKLNNNLVERLSDADKEGIEITIVYGKDEMNKQQMNILKSLNNIEIFFCKNLHAKCYHNENSMIISSMNLFEFSEKNNREMGVLIDSLNDSEIFSDALKEITSIKNSSKAEVVRFKKEVKVEIPVVVDETYSDPWNIHLPMLFKSLKLEYPQANIILGNDLLIPDFPKKGVTTQINGRIDFRFQNATEFNDFKKKYKVLFNELFPVSRIFWNYFVINIYPPKHYDLKIPSELPKNDHDFYIYIIKGISKYLSS